MTKRKKIKVERTRGFWQFEWYHLIAYFLGLILLLCGLLFFIWTLDFLADH